MGHSSRRRRIVVDTASEMMFVPQRISRSGQQSVQYSGSSSCFVDVEAVRLTVSNAMRRD